MLLLAGAARSYTRSLRQTMRGAARSLRPTASSAARSLQPTLRRMTMRRTTRLLASATGADALPALAAFGPPLVLVAIGLLGVHYKLAYGKMDNKGLCLAGFLGYFVILFVSKGFDLGFPKDTGAEQVVALRDETYSVLHLGLHGALLANLALTACAVPSPFASAKTA